MGESSFGGPFVQVAAICAMPIVDNTGLLSVIKILDRIPLAGPTDEMKPQPLHQLALVIVVKSGELVGKYNLKITTITPSGKRQPAGELGALFEGAERGVMSITPLAVIAEEEGLYWFEVTLESSVLTRIPLRVMYQKIQGVPMMPNPPSQSD